MRLRGQGDGSCARQPRVYNDMDNNEVMSLLTTGLLVAAVVQVIVTAITLKGLKHARTAAQAAKRSSDIASQTAQQQLRAYVGCIHFRIDDWGPDDAGEAIVVMEYENVGATPALNTEMWFGMLATTDGEDHKFEKPANLVQSKATVFPRQGGSAAVALPRSMDSWALYVQGRLQIYAYGEIEYDDIFGERRRTTFRYEHNSRRRSGHFGASPAGNYAT